MWKPVTENKKAVAIWSYHGTKEVELSFRIGDTIILLEYTEGWYRGYVSTHKTSTGIFPSTYVHIQEEFSGEGESSVVTKTLVEELDIVLREWLVVLMEKFSKDSMQWFNEVRQVMLELIDLRRQLVSGQLPQEPARGVRIQITNCIDAGNQRLGMDLVPSMEGKIVDTTNTSIVDLHQVHLKSLEHSTNASQMSLDPGWVLAAASALDKSSHPQGQLKGTEGMAAFAHHIHLQLKNFGCSIGEESQAFFALYDARANRFISERYLAKFNKLGVPNNIDKIGNLCTVFCDLSNKDIVRDLYLTCHIIRVGTMLQTNKKAIGNFRRPYGCGVVSLSTVLTEPVNDQSTTAKEFVMKIFQGSAEAEFSQLHDNIIRKHSNKTGTTSTTNIGISLSLRMLHGHFDQLKREMPLLFSKGVTMTRKLGFSDFIMPGDVRNDLYLMLNRAEFERGRKAASRNIEVTVHVINGNKEKMKCIWLGSDESETDEYRSAIYYHTNQPHWIENIRLSIPMEQFKDTHIRFEFRHCSTSRGERSLFAMAFMRLMKEDGTTLEDTEHELFVFKCSENQDFRDLSYMSLPFCTQDMVSRASPAFGHNTYSRNMKEYLAVRTVICSTKLTQNVFLLGLLKWKTHPEKLKEILHSITKVGGQEIVRVLQDILDALFNILDERASDFERDVFDALVYILGILGDTRFKSFTAVLDTYIDNFFASTQAHLYLVAQLKWYIDHALIEKAEIVINTLKAVQNLFKFIFRSHVLYQKATGDMHDGNIQDSMRCLFSSMNNLMTHKKEEKLQLHQLILLRNFSHISNELRVMYTPPEVSQFIIELLEHMPRDLPPEVLRAKLVFLSETIKSNLFKDTLARKFLLEPCAKQLKMHIDNREDATMCVDILGSILGSLYKISKTESVDFDVGIMVKLLLESILDMVMSLDRKSSTLVLCISVLLDLLRLMKDYHYQEFKVSLRDVERHREFIKTVFKVFKDLSSREIYPTDWMAMRMLSNSVILNATRRVSVDLSSTFLNAENANVMCYNRLSGGENWLERRVGYELWFDYFRLACVFITQPCLQLETMTIAKQDRLKSRYGDMRVDMAQEIVSKWQSLGDHKSLFRDLTRPFLEVTMVRQSEIRRVILPIIFDIMCCEKLERGNFNQLEDDLIDKLDTMVCVEKKGDENYTEIFSQVLLERIASQPWKEEGEQFVDKVKRLLERLIDYRNVSNTSVENRHLRLNCMYNLMNFYKDDANREDIYARYIYRLQDLHLESHDYTEAAFTLLVLAKSLEWRNKDLQADDKHPKQTEMQRKEALYMDIINLMDKGEMWEFGIPLCKELSLQYESKLFDYAKNSRILQTQAAFFDNILKKQRQPPTYFRVTFYGNFPLKSKAWIYRGRPFDQLGTILEQLQADFPKSKKWQKNTRPESTELQNNQYIQIRSVEPVATDNVFKDLNVPIQISSFYDHHNITKFKFDRPFNKGEKDPSNEFKTLWVEQTKLVTDTSLPSLLRWVDVIDSETVEITPIQNAVGVMESKNKALRSLIADLYANPSNNINPLSMILQGMIDAAVQGGPKKYKAAFLSNEYKKLHPEDADLCEKLEKLVVDQMKVLKDGVDLHERLCPDGLNDFQRNLEKKLSELRRDFGLSSVPMRVASTPPPQTVKQPKGSTASTIFTYRRSVVPGQPSSGKTPAINEEPASSSKFYLDAITETNTSVSPSQHATLNRLRPLEREQAMRRGRATVASMRQYHQEHGLSDRRIPQETSPIKRVRATIATTWQSSMNSESGGRGKLHVPWPLKKSDSNSSLPSDRSSSASLPSPDLPDMTSSRMPMPEKPMKSPLKDRDVTNLLRETYKGSMQRNSSGSRPNSSSSVASSSSSSSRESASIPEDPNIPPALPERKPSLPAEPSIPRPFILDPASQLPERPENGDASPPPLPTKKTSIGGVSPAQPPSRRRVGYDTAPSPILCPDPPPVPLKTGRSQSITADMDHSPRPSSGESEDIPPPIPSRPERRSATNPSHLDTLPTSPNQHSLDAIPGSPPPPANSPPPPNIPPPELPVTIVSPAAEKLAGELKSEVNGKPKAPPPVPLRPKSRRGSAHPSPETPTS